METYVGGRMNNGWVGEWVDGSMNRGKQISEGILAFID